METLLRKVTTNKYLPLRMFQSIEVDEKKIKILDDSGCAEDATTTGVVMSTMIDHYVCYRNIRNCTHCCRHEVPSSLMVNWYVNNIILIIMPMIYLVNI